MRFTAPSIVSQTPSQTPESASDDSDNMKSCDCSSLSNRTKRA